MSPKINVVLFEPEIPQNVGNIARTCLAVGGRLILVGRLGFFLDDRHLRRAGVGYIDRLEIVCYRDFDHFRQVECSPANAGASLKDASRIIPVSKRGKYLAWDFPFGKNDFLLFGSEGKGLPSEILQCYYENSVRLPMGGVAQDDDGSMEEPVRCLNLATSVGVIVYEALRRNRGFCLHQETACRPLF